MTYADFKDLPRKTDSDRILRDKAFNIAKNPKYEDNLLMKTPLHLQINLLSKVKLCQTNN